GCRRAAADRERLGPALARAGRGRRARRPSGVIAPRQGALERNRGAAGATLQDARPAEAALGALDRARGARPDRAALRQAARAVDGAALPAALGDDAAEAALAGQGAPAGGDRGLAAAGLSGDRPARQGGRRGDLLG